MYIIEVMSITSLARARPEIAITLFPNEPFTFDAYIDSLISVCVGYMCSKYLDDLGVNQCMAVEIMIWNVRISNVVHICAYILYV